MRLYPALDIRGGDVDLLAAFLDDFSPTALEERDGRLRAFFANATARDAARDALAPRFQIAAIEVSDDDWARRSQEGLPPVTVGRLTLVSDPSLEASTSRHQPPHARPEPSTITLVIQPSMGFGTGHHATTRLCLDALQRIDVRGKRVVDVGTGSGVLAIAADRLGAADAVGIDVDADAVRSARQNLALNPDAARVRFEVVDFADARLAPADVVLANLTGAALVRAADPLRAAVVEGGILIVSGLQSHERGEVAAALQPADILWEREEASWVGLAMKKR